LYKRLRTRLTRAITAGLWSFAVKWKHLPLFLISGLNVSYMEMYISVR